MVVPSAVLRVLSLVICMATSACCSYQVTVAGSHRSCVPFLGGRGPGRPKPVASTPRVDARWDPELAIYRVAGEPCLFFRLGLFYRTVAGRWQSASAHDGPWHDMSGRDLPSGFRSDLALSICGEAPSGAPPVR